MKHKIKNGCMRLFLATLLGLFSFLSLNAQGGSLTVNGVVKDTKGEAVIGASVVLKGTTTGALTDLDGRYSITAPANGTLEVKYLGYITQSIAIQNRTSIIFVLKEDTELLDEVVVIGYGTVKKSDATGSLTAIKVDEKNKGLATTAQDLLAGKVAGVTVVSNGGRPGDGATIRIRGGSSLDAKNDPLIIIDGVILSNDLAGSSNFLSSVNPDDIETFTVLKDASATAIYGSRASNGVILITTKKGGGDKIKVTYNGSFSLSTKRNSMDVMGANQYREFVTNMFTGTSQEKAVLAKLGTASTDWQDEIFKTAFGTDHNVSVFGSIKNTVPYRVSVGYTNQEGILETSKMERMTTSISLTPSLFDDHLKFNINARGMFSKTRFANTGAIGSAISFDPTQPVMNDSKWRGYFTWVDAGNELASIAGKNPVAMLQLQNDRAYVRNFTGNIQTDYKLHFFPDLRVNLNLGMDIATTTGTDFQDPLSPTSYSRTEGESGSRKNFNNFKNDQLMEMYGQYMKEVKSIKSKFDVMGGYSWQNFKKFSNEETFYVSEIDLSNLDLIKVGNFYDPKSYNLQSFFGRFNYTFNDKYLLTTTVRTDASSRFTKDNRWGVFPSLALAWKMKEESFLKDVNAISEMKLRLGWGKTGQQDLGDEFYYPSRPYYTNGKGQAMYPMGKNEDGTPKWEPLLRPKGYNEDLKWETTATWNAGIDFGFLNNRITGALEVYSRKTTDLLNRAAPVMTGTSTAEELPQNIGSLENKGIEFSINARPIVSKEFEWLVGFNIAYNKSKITKLLNNAEEGYKSEVKGSETGGDGGRSIQVYATGYAPRMYYVYEQVYDTNGKPIEGVYVDRDKNGKIDEGDLYLHKKPDADVLMGFNSRVTYKNWDFGFNGRVSLGNYVFNAMAVNGADMAKSTVFANTISLSNRPISALETNFQSKQAQSDYYIQNASFLKIDNITLGYTFNKLFGSKTSARVYSTVQNPIVITKYKGLDPEVFNGIDHNFYPRPLTVMLGFNLNF